MKYYSVNGGRLFPFQIPKITTRDARLMEARDAKEGCLLPGAEGNLHAVQAVCERLAQGFGTFFSTEVCLRSKVARVGVFLPLWSLCCGEWELLQGLRQHLAGVTVQPFRFGLQILFLVKFFGTEASTIEKDLKEIYQNYTDKA